jgi:hypothetical protein
MPHAESAPDQTRSGRLVPIWVAVVSGIFGVIASFGAATISTATGGPITINIGSPASEQPDQAALPSTTIQAAAVTPFPSVATTRSPANSSVTYLRNINPATGGTSEKGSHSILGQRYEESFKKFCPGSITPEPTSWPVSGYSRLSGVIGVADDEDNALNRVGHVTIRDENGADLVAPFDVSLGKPHPIDIQLNGAVQVQITCAGRDTNGDSGPSLYVTMGDPALHRP